MKRRLSIALLLALLFTSVFPAALAEPPVEIDGYVEAQVGPALMAGDTGLTVEGMEDAQEASAEAPAEPAVEAPAAASEPSPYVRVVPASATVFLNPDGTQPLGTFNSGAVLLKLGQEVLTRVAAYTERGVLVGYTDPNWLSGLTEAEHTAYMETVAGGAPVALYENNLNLPLALVACAFPDAAATEAETPADPAAPAPESAPGAAVGIQLSADSITIGLKETFNLTVSTLPEGSPLPQVSWRSDNPKYVRVDEATGAIYGAKRGAAYVFAAMAGGNEVACLVTVEKAPKKIALNPSKLTLSSGGMTAQLSWSLPRGGVTNHVSFASNNPAVATVDENGLVTSVNPGKAVVAIKTHNGKTSKCKVTVVPAPASIAFPAGGISMAVGQTLPIGAQALSATGEAVESSFTYVVEPGSADPGCVLVDPAAGTLIGVRKGQAVITAIAYNGVASSCPVVVAAAPAAIRLSEDNIMLGVKDIYTDLLVELAPAPGETEFASAVTWSVSNPKIARVDEATGAIYGLKRGSCTITATTVNGLSASCGVQVLRAPGKISLSPANGTLEIGQTGQYKVSFSRKAGGSVTFATSDPSIATIDDDGVVTAVSVGTVAIAATSYNGKKAYAKLVVTQGSVDLPVDEDANVDSTTDHYYDGMTTAEKLEYVIYVAQTQLNKPYIYGGGYSKDSSPSGFDCSGLVYWSFLHIGVKVEASAYRQGYDDSLPKITNAAELRRGDIVCFNTNDSDGDASDHTGIYLGNGRFIHASSSAKKVMISTLASGYYSRTFSWGRRVLP